MLFVSWARICNLSYSLTYIYMYNQVSYDTGDRQKFFHGQGADKRSEGPVGDRGTCVKGVGHQSLGNR